ncbi:hypothetical protein ACIGEZ_17435 [Streptomyces sp. NPDC085481]|uniref:hypothetical protein n=1 Tax=Streptomyces sp. NPDC085481 TaxID=3365727 RepID=UPI0037D6DE26
MENVDQDAVLRARTLLLGSARLSTRQEVEAYRVLAQVSPRAYLPKLAEALVSHGYDASAEVRLALHAEAAEAARRIDPDAPNRTKQLHRALEAYEHSLFRAGLRAEGRAVCEEMAEAGRYGFERGQVESRWYGHGRLATVLAEEGRHREAAEMHGRMVRSAGAGVADWNVIEWAAELGAAGLHEEAVAAFALVVDDRRREATEDRTPLGSLAWDLVHHTRLLETAGRGAEAAATRRETLELLARLARTGESRSWSNILAWWATLFVLSGRPAEPAPSPDAPVPPFGTESHQWSPDTRQAYFDAVPALEAEAARLSRAGRLAELCAVHRRLTLRSALRAARRSYLIEEPLRPLFDEGVALARRLPGGHPALPQALTDRAMFLVAAERYGEAYADFAEAVPLLDGPAPPVSVISHPTSRK